MGFCLKVWGDFACFTRPEMKVERVSYEVMTPSAARAIFEAIYWKPQIAWRITEIEVLKPIQWINVRRNELASGKFVKNANYRLIEEERQQKAGLFLYDVAYRIHGYFDVLQPSENEAKHASMFHRRAQKGQCVYQPYLGCREFSCHFQLIENIENDREYTPAIQITKNLGWMLYDLEFSTKDKKETTQPMFFCPMLENGVVNVPNAQSSEVRK